MGADTVGELLETVDAVYQTVLDARCWPEALDRVSGVAGAHGTLLVVSDPVMSELAITAHPTWYDDTATREYTERELAGDELRWVEMLEEVDPLTILRDTEIWPDRARYQAMPSVRWLLDRQLYHRCALRLSGHGGWRDLLAMLYPAGRGGMSHEEERRLAPLLPHLARATEIRRPFALLQARYRAVLSVLDRLGIGVLVLVDDDRIVLGNAEAERILDTRDALRRRADGRLAGPASPEGDRLRRALAAAGGGDQADATTLALPRGAGVAPYVVEVAPFRERADGELGEALRGALVCLIDPERRPGPSLDALAQAYGLTGAEAAVCRLIADGLTAREIADERGVGLDTVKTQSKAILGKVGCRNRVELVRRALSIAPPIVEETPEKGGR